MWVRVWRSQDTVEPFQCLAIKLGWSCLWVNEANRLLSVWYVLGGVFRWYVAWSALRQWVPFIWNHPGWLKIESRVLPGLIQNWTLSINKMKGAAFVSTPKMSFSSGWKERFVFAIALSWKTCWQINATLCALLPYVQNWNRISRHS